MVSEVAEQRTTPQGPDVEKGLASDNGCETLTQRKVQQLLREGVQEDGPGREAEAPAARPRSRTQSPYLETDPPGGFREGSLCLKSRQVAMHTQEHTRINN